MKVSAAYVQYSGSLERASLTETSQLSQLKMTFDWNDCRSVSGKTLESKASPGESCPAPRDRRLAAHVQNPSSKSPSVTPAITVTLHLRCKTRLAGLQLQLDDATDSNGTALVAVELASGYL